MYMCIYIYIYIHMYFKVYINNRLQNIADYCFNVESKQTRELASSDNNK